MTVPSRMRALRLESPGCLREAEVSVPTPSADELLIETAVSTICTSDLGDIDRNPFGIPLPRILGHEGAGIVRAVGRDVTGFKPGDRVAAHPVIPCKSCVNCLRGLGHLCTRMGHLGLDREGTFADYFTIPAERARRIPDALPMSRATLLEPIAVCIEAIERTRTQAGQSLLIAGDGPFGLLIARLAVKRYALRVILVGRHPFRLSRNPEATTVLDQGAADTIAAVRAWSPHGEGVDAAVLAVGASSALDVCLASLRSRGRVVIFSALHDEPKIDLFRLHTQELEIAGACNDEDYINVALECLSDPVLALETYVTHQLPFSEWKHAFDLARSGKDRALKVALVMGGSR